MLITDEEEAKDLDSSIINPRNKMVSSNYIND